MVLDDERLARLGLVTIEGLWPRRLELLGALDDPIGSWSALLDGRRPAGVAGRLAEAWPDLVRRARAFQDREIEAELRAIGAEVLVPGDDGWPFDDDPEPPLAVVVRGDRDLLNRRPAVALVGTRRPTGLGRAVADELGATLAEAGVVIVSGLALGIDGAAHRGALRVGGGTIAVVGSGVDRPYPARHGELWDTIAEDGLLVSEYGLGVPPARWRFPARNRLIAALAESTVVVESQARGGALSTAAEALERGRSVGAVPGSVRSPASDGTNALLVDGAAPVRGAVDVFDLLGITPSVGRDAAVVALDLLDAEVARGGCTIDALVAAAGGDVAEALVEIGRRIAAGRWRRNGTVIELIP